MTTCIGCGCTDEEACDGGCSWIAKSVSERAGLCSSCGLGEIGAVDVDEADFQCEQAEREWAFEDADQFAIDQDQKYEGDRLILPGDPEYSATLRGRRP
jgi:hypothetical protein